LQTIAYSGYTRAIEDAHDADAGQIAPLDAAALGLLDFILSLSYRTYR